MMPIAYLDVSEGIQIEKKKKLVQEISDALHEGYPFPDDVRIFLREWSIDSVSQNGRLGSEPARPVLMMQIPQGVRIDAKREVIQGINSRGGSVSHARVRDHHVRESARGWGVSTGVFFRISKGVSTCRKRCKASKEGTDTLSSDLMETTRREDWHYRHR